ncbi:hypothetical protein N431DRAFT_428975 [Stipitochalara longipes BDJ]|nr:hypothetical protein N431DRAFT_428975 [Stipitochalara longipes BDJ]
MLPHGLGNRSILTWSYSEAIYRNSWCARRGSGSKRGNYLSRRGNCQEGVGALKRAHTYKEPAYEVYKRENF